MVNLKNQIRCMNRWTHLVKSEEGVYSEYFKQARSIVAGVTRKNDVGVDKADPPYLKNKGWFLETGIGTQRLACQINTGSRP